MRSVTDFSQLDATDGSDIGVFNTEQPIESALDVSSNPDGTVTAGAVKPITSPQKPEDREAIPEWGQTLGARVDKLENEVRQMNKKMDDGFAEILRRLPPQ